MKGWYKISVDAESKTANIKLYGKIGADISSAAFSMEIDDLAKQGVKSINLIINSGGGSMWDGNHICNILSAFNKGGGKSKGYVTGMAASMASLILMNCSEAYMAPNAQLMIHEPTLSVNDASIDEIDGLKNLVTNMRDNAADCYAAKTGMPKANILDMMSKTTWMSSKEALKMKFINGISADYPKDPFEDNDEVEAVNQVLVENYQNPNPKTPEMTTEKTDKTEVTNEAVVALTAQLNEVQAERKKEKAEAIVDKAIAERRISANQKDAFVKMAIADPESAKTVLDGLTPAPVISASIKAGISNTEGREKWDYDKWATEDPAGLRMLKQNDPETFEGLKNALVAKVNASGKVDL